MIKKGNEYKWTTEAEHAFHTMKHTLCLSPILVLLIDDAPFFVDTHASEVAIAGILEQEQP